MRCAQAEHHCWRYGVCGRHREASIGTTQKARHRAVALHLRLLQTASNSSPADTQYQFPNDAVYKNKELAHKANSQQKVKRPAHRSGTFSIRASLYSTASNII